jgi:hypothetical protein
MRRIRAIAIAMLATAAGAAGTATASEAATYNLAGGGAWSSGSQWQAGVAPSGTVGAISLGDLGTPCAPCFTDDDISGLATGELDIDLSQGYDEYGDSLTISGNGGVPNLGIDATLPDGPAPTSEYFSGDTDLSGGINLGADQTWDVAGDPGGAGLGVGTVIGGQTLDLELSDGATVTADTFRTGAITADGDGTLALDPSYDAVPTYQSRSGLLPDDGVTLEGGASLNVDTAGSVYTGSLTVSGGSDDLQSLVDIGQGAGGVGDSGADTALTVGGDVTLDQWTDVYLDLDASGSGGYSSLSSAGDLALNRATVYLEQGTTGATSGCTAFDPGTSFPVISAVSNGSITGDLTYFDTAGNFDTLAPGMTSDPIPLQADYCPDTDGVAVLTYGTSAITATIVTAPTDGSDSPVISGTPSIGGVLTVTSPGSWSAYPAPITYSYQWVACTDTDCSDISGATNSSFSPTSAQAGDSVGVVVTATNTVGSTVDYSNLLGPVPQPPATSPNQPTPQAPTPVVTTPTPTPSTPVLTAFSPATAAEITSALRGIVTHPSGKKADAALVKHGDFKTSFAAPTRGSLSIVWTTNETSGTGKHKKHKTVVVAIGSARASSASTVGVEIHLTATGKTLLMKKSTGLSITATEKFTPTGGSSSSVTKKFSV